ncbi:MAG TPA: secretin N-terminal domain-containing protein [Burkholderiaceae bacterium]|jgi:general secretion pathway protein D
MPSRLTNRIKTPRGFWACLIITLILTGCAAQMNYNDGKDLVAQDKVEEGLAKFQKAMQQDPQNLEYKQAYLQTKERAVYSYLTQADKFADAGQRDAAEKNYQRALGLDPSSERALDGLLRLKRDSHHDQLINEATAKLDKKDTESARLKLSSVLSENPNNQAALALQNKLTEKTDAVPSDTELTLAYKKKITIEFKDVTLKQVFEVISRTSGLNFMFDKDVKTDQKTSIFLKNSTIEEAIHMTLVTNQLEQSVENANTILIYPNTPGKQKDYQQMMVQSFYLTNADAKAVAASLKSLLKTRDIVVDEKLNLLMVRDTPEALAQAEKLIALQDMAEPEVMLEVEILEVQRKRLLDLGIQWPASMSLTPLSASGLTVSGTTGTTGATGPSITLRDLYHQNSGTIGVGISPVTINANNQDSDANLLANPRIRVRNHEKAKILIGERVPNITSTSTATGFVSQSINYVDVGLTLNVEPTVYLDNQVAIKVSLEVSNIVSQLTTSSGSVAYQIGTRNASTVLRLKDGENQVLAGLINDEDRRSGNKVPGLGDLPLIGRLFGSTSNDNQKTEIVLSITPHLIHNIQRPNASLSKFRSGTESSYYVRSGAASGGVGTPNEVLTPRPATAVTPAAPTTATRNATSAQPTNPASSNNIGSSNNNIQSNIPSINESQISTNGTVANGAQLQWQGPTQVKKGDAFSVQLIMQSDIPVNSLPLIVGFDNTALQVTSISEGIFLKQGGAKTNFTSRVDPSGQILITDTRTDTGGATSPGTVATINFIAIAPTNSTRVQLLSAAPIDLSGRAVSTSLPVPQSIQIQP